MKYQIVNWFALFFYVGTFGFMVIDVIGKNLSSLMIQGIIGIVFTLLFYKKGVKVLQLKLERTNEVK